MKVKLYKKIQTTISLCLSSNSEEHAWSAACTNTKVPILSERSLFWWRLTDIVEQSKTEQYLQDRKTRIYLNFKVLVYQEGEKFSS